jgi:hypothetical protein
MALDTECDTRQNTDGTINWSGLPEVLYIGYDNNGIKLAWIIQLKKISKLPVALNTLLAPDQWQHSLYFWSGCGKIARQLVAKANF